MQGRRSGAPAVDSGNGRIAVIKGLFTMRHTTLFELLKHGVHFGHQTAKWHPRMRPFIFTSRNGIHILNLESTLAQIEKAQVFLRDTTAAGGTILFVGTKRQAKEIVAAAASDAGALSITERWLGGLFTNFATVSRVLERLRKLTEDREAGRLGKYTKKERLKFDGEIAKLEKLVGGIRTMTKLPDAIVLIDIKTEKTALRESLGMKIPVVAMVDTNTDPKGIAYPIPANDDATKSIQLVTELLADAVREGRAAALERQQRAAEQTPPPEGIAPTAIPEPAQKAGAATTDAAA